MKKVNIKYTVMIKKKKMRLDIFMQEIRTYDFGLYLHYGMGKRRILRNAIK